MAAKINKNQINKNFKKNEIKFFKQKPESEPELSVFEMFCQKNFKILFK